MRNPMSTEATFIEGMIRFCSRRAGHHEFDDGAKPVRKDADYTGDESGGEL